MLLQNWIYVIDWFIAIGTVWLYLLYQNVRRIWMSSPRRMPIENTFPKCKIMHVHVCDLSPNRLDYFDVKICEITMRNCIEPDVGVGWIFWNNFNTRTHRERKRYQNIYGSQKPVTTMPSQWQNIHKAYSNKEVNGWNIFMSIDFVTYPLLQHGNMYHTTTLTRSIWICCSFVLCSVGVTFRVTYTICFAFGSKNNNTLMTWVFT